MVLFASVMLLIAGVGAFVYSLQAILAYHGSDAGNTPGAFGTWWTVVTGNYPPHPAVGYGKFVLVAVPVSVIGIIIVSIFRPGSKN